MALSVAGSSSLLAQKLDLRLPIESYVLQAFVSEAIKPLVPGVVTFGAGHFYISQSDKGGLVFGGDLDGYKSYAQRGNLPVIEDVMEGGMALMPLSAVCACCVNGRGCATCRWTARRSSILGRCPASISTPDGAMAVLKPRPPQAGASPIPSRAMNPIRSAPAYRLDRFRTGHVIDEKGVGAQPNLH